MKRTAAREIEIAMPKRIWTASFSEAEHPRESTGGVRRQVESKEKRGRKQKKEQRRDINACREEKEERSEGRQMRENER